jgi:hypothetical protein
MHRRSVVGETDRPGHGGWFLAVALPARGGGASATLP